MVKFIYFYYVLKNDIYNEFDKNKKERMDEHVTRIGDERMANIYKN